MGKSARARIAIGALVLVVALPIAGLTGHAALKHHQATVACTAVKTVEKETDSRRQQMLSGSGLVVAFVGDSYTQGQWLSDPTNGYAFVASKKLDVRPYVDGSGGSGFTNSGPCGNAVIGSRIDKAMAYDPGVVVLQGGINDLGHAGEMLAATSAIDEVHRKSSQTKVFLVGSFSPPAVDRMLVNRTNDQLKIAARTAGATFIDPSGWTFPVLNDRVHPTAKGHEIIGALIARRIDATN